MLRVRRMLTLGALVVLAAWPGPAAAQPFELAVKEDRVIGAGRGTLVFDADAVEYRASNLRPDGSRTWPYAALKQVRVLSPTTIVLETYEDRGLLRLGSDRAYEFEVTDGHVTSALVDFLLARIDRPLVTAVMPPLGDAPAVRVVVKHQRRGRGSEGTLLLFDDSLVYLTEREREARYWRLRDLASVLRLAPHRLVVEAYEDSGTRPYTFELKASLPMEAYEALWQRVNAPLVRRPEAASGRIAEAPDCCVGKASCARAVRGELKR